MAFDSTSCRLLEAWLTISVSQARLQPRHIDGASLARADAGFVELARAGKETAPAPMQRDEEYVGIGLEDVLRAIAVVHVPIENRHALDAMVAPSGRGCDCGIVEEAEAECLVALGVVARRTHQRKRAAHLAEQHRLCRLEGRARSTACRALRRLVVIDCAIALWFTMNAVIRPLLNC